MRIIDGKKISDEILESLKQEVSKKNLKKALAVIIVGEDPASKVYVNNKKKACERIGIESLIYALDTNATENELLDLIVKLNNDPKITGILVQQPLPKHINEFTVVNKISKDKDLDCFHPYNIGLLSLGIPKFMPCTPAGVIELLEYENLSVDGKLCAIIGRSDIVGKPLQMLLTQRNATTILCHSRTKNLAEITSQCDFVFVAVGKPKFLTQDYIKQGAVVIDIGINRLDNKLCGDVDFDNVSKKSSFITPVPGGVGPMTIAMLMKNVCKG